MNSPIFHETQKFRNAWLWVILIALLFILPLTLLFSQDLPQNEAITSITIIFCISFVLVWLFYFLKLDIWITELGISYRFSPLINEKHFDWNEIEKIEVAQYHPIKDYGGWGIRLGLGRKGVAYNVSGNWGIHLILKNGKRIMLGTQKPEEVKKILDSIIHK